MSPSRTFPGLGHAYDLIVVGAGISGSELALRAARGGQDVLLVTTSLDTVYNFAGDGAVLRPHHGTLMSEAHAELAGEDGYLGTWAMHRRAKQVLEHQPGVHLLQSSVSALTTSGDRVAGVHTWEGVDRLAARVVLAAGSFLGARLFVGELEEQAGRLSEMAYDELYGDLLARGFVLEPLTLEAAPGGGSLPYRVECSCFGAEWDGETFALDRIPGLYAVGVCADGYLSYEEAALQGSQLGERLILEGA